MSKSVDRVRAVLAAAGTPRLVFRIMPQELAAITRATLAAFVAAFHVK